MKKESRQSDVFTAGRRRGEKAEDRSPSHLTFPLKKHCLQSVITKVCTIYNLGIFVLAGIWPCEAFFFVHFAKAPDHQSSLWQTLFASEISTSVAIKTKYLKRVVVTDPSNTEWQNLNLHRPPKCKCYTYNSIGPGAVFRHERQLL